MTKRKFIGVKTGYMALGTNAGPMWSWGKKIPFCDIDSTAYRNGGLFVSYYEANANKSNMATFFWHMVWHGDYDYYPFEHPTSKQPKHPQHYEQGGSKKWEVGADPSGWMYQTKNISSWSDVQNNKNKILYFYGNGQRDDPWSICWTSYRDDRTRSEYLQTSAAVNDDRKKNAWFSNIAYGERYNDSSIAVSGSISQPRYIRGSRMRNVVGFTLNCLWNGKEGSAAKAGLYLATVGMIMQRPGNSELVMCVPTERVSGGRAINQNIVNAKYWDDSGSEVKSLVSDLQKYKGQLQNIGYYCSKKQIETIMKDKLEFVGVFWHLIKQGQGAGGTHAWGGIGIWNFRPLCVGDDGNIGYTWNNSRYNILGKARTSYTKQGGIYLS